MPYYPPPSTGTGAADASLSPLSPSVNTTVTANYSLIMSDWFDIQSGLTADIGAGGVLEIT